ncbi:ORF6C domain-containing protein [[Clostridium] colinum]|uniref:ORF6C domain-containing protein n=1 Tax=[Clostridium] colinum TaxID=36835 RepID=UPI0020249A25|nr:ORF6C domain-containing protein [[Clostridium] colinum]
MNDIELFKNESFGEIRTLLVNDEVWFVGKDVASALGYERPDNAIRSHIDEEDKLMHQISASGQNRNMTIINESGLYSLILSSKLPQAKEFKRWVTNEILPTIRKTGVYTIQPKTPMQLLELEFQAIKEVDNKVEEVKQDLENFKQDMPLLALEIDKIKNARNRTAVNVLGGKDSNAYKNRSLRSKVYQDMSREIKRQFGVETYKAIKRNQCDKVIEIIKSYVPPMYLLQEIENENLQLAI